MKTLRLILGDQLNHHHSWYQEANPDHHYLIMEMGQELSYAKHHIQKVVAFFLAMRGFAADLRANGHQVQYLTLDDPANTHSLEQNLKQIIEAQGIEKLEYQLPDEWRLDEQLRQIAEGLDIATEPYDTEHFLSERDELEQFFKDKKQHLMESFYRMMRKKYNILIQDGKPVGGKWNYDHENRRKAPKGTPYPFPKVFPQDVKAIVAMLEKHGTTTIGRINPEQFIWPTTRAEALELYDFFLEQCLPDFGKYQDAMTEEGWSLFHSRISFALNAKLLHPLEIIQKAEAHWQQHPEVIPLSSAEGFIRQILGWREYMRGIYWKFMPEYSEKNFFEHQRPFPGWFWTGETKMKCLSHSINQSLTHAYAHHIQRLMITGNFALLAGIHPDEVDAWYLGIYIDAIEWVEITNTRGMSQFADGGIVATKPYVSSANYVHKMSHYCGNCHYDHKKKTGDRACPFNSLYWDFIDRNREQLAKNPRMSMIYRVWDKNSAENKNQTLEQAAQYLNKLEAL